jgi:opacity protein-like surface antigen
MIRAKRIITMLAAGWAGCAAFTGAALAADPAGSWPAPEPEVVAPQFTELLSGWYLRGDLGYRQNTVNGADLAPTAASGPITNAYYDKNTFAGTVGAGYKLGFLRTDVTADFGMPMAYRADTAFGGGDYYNARISAITLLGNAYIDMGTWWGFTPYVGAGLGATYFHAAKFLTPLSTEEVTTTNWSMSWALMAGVSYQFASNMAIDVGYRYINFGDARAGDPRFNSDYLDLHKLTAQEIRVGLRLQFE